MAARVPGRKEKKVFRSAKWRPSEKIRKEDLSDGTNGEMEKRAIGRSAKMDELRREIETLRNEIRRHDRLYYTEAAPEIADHEYDRLMRQLRELEAAHPEYHDPASPTQRIGDPLESGFAKVAHRVPMLSMDNTYTKSELRNFMESRVLKPLSGQMVSWVVEPKVDGVAVSLIYERGRLVQAITRGDGRIGDEITGNIRTVRGIPLQLEADPQTLPEWLEIRGEVYMNHDDLEAFLASRKDSGERKRSEPEIPSVPRNTITGTERKPDDEASDNGTDGRIDETYGGGTDAEIGVISGGKTTGKMTEEKIFNPRNVTAGAIHQKSPEECARRRLRFMAHSVGDVTALPVTTHSEFLTWIRSLGVPTAPKVAVFPDPDAAVDYCDSLMEEIHELPFEIDGFVLKVDRFDQREVVGSTSKSPRWMVAYKFEKYEAEAKLADILWRVGKSGAVTPVAVLVDPEYDGVANTKEYVVIAGTKVRRASLHNPHEITSKDVRLGDRVIVAKAGKIIPQIVRVETHLRPEGPDAPSPYPLPRICPVCGGPLVKRFAGQPDSPIDASDVPVTGTFQIFCTSPTCPAQLKERIVHYASRRAMDLTGLGDEMVGRLVNAGLLRGLGDLYR
ncbi:MAG: hypothetical protein Q4C47_03080, partial [Planctomycetia bacterium]|nr:hypothetical protein [Planctomycetia bacterium]